MSSKYSKYARAAYVCAALCFSLASVAGVAAASVSITPVVSVSVHDFAFTPNTLTIVKGTQVRFTNTGESLHRVVSDDGTIDSHPLQPGHNATFTFDTAGVFHLHCEIHPIMTMTVTVLTSQPAVGAGADPARRRAHRTRPPPSPRPPRSRARAPASSQP